MPHVVIARTFHRLLVVAPAMAALALAVQWPAAAASTPAQRCAATKLKAAGKKHAGKLKCYANAVSKGEAVDDACLEKAETKFAVAFAKADAAGGCVTTGNAQRWRARST